MTAYILARFDKRYGYYNVSSPLRTMTREEAEICRKASCIEYPSLADDYAVLEVIIPVQIAEPIAEQEGAVQ